MIDEEKKYFNSAQKNRMPAVRGVAKNIVEKYNFRYINNMMERDKGLGELMILQREDLLCIKEASEWATKYLGKTVTTSNISYLIQYGRVRQIGGNGTTQVSKSELVNYYKCYNGKRKISWKGQLGEDLNWDLSFDQYKETETTKHVHRLHPYKGKFIPQLVEYFLDSHTDNFKKG